MAFVHRVLWILQAMWIILSETIHILRILNISGCPRKFYHRCMYIPPSSGKPLSHINVPFFLDCKEVWGCFLVSGVKTPLFWKIYENTFNPPILNYGFTILGLTLSKPPIYPIPTILFLNQIIIIILDVLGKAEHHLNIYIWLYESNNFTRLSITIFSLLKR